MKNKKDIFLYSLIFILTYGLKITLSNLGVYLGYGAVFLMMSGGLILLGAVFIGILATVGIGIAKTISTKQPIYAFLSLSIFLLGIFLPDPISHLELMHFKLNKSKYVEEVNHFKNQIAARDKTISCEYLPKNMKFNIYKESLSGLIVRVDFHKFTPNRRIIYVLDTSYNLNDSDLIDSKQLEPNWYWAEFDFN